MGGVIGITRDWLAHFSFDCHLQRTFKKRKRPTLFKRPDNGKTAEEVLKIEGYTTAAFYIGYNERTEGIDLLVAVIGGVNIEVLGLVGAKAEAKGQVLIKTRPNDTPIPKFTVRFIAEARILFAIFKVCGKVSWSPDEGWFFEFYFPKDQAYFLGDDPAFFKGFKKLCVWCKDNWKSASAHR